MVAGTAAVVLGAFGAGTYYSMTGRPRAPEVQALETDGLLRAHSPILGPSEAPVTIVEFFDPSCEACRAYYPVVKEILQKHPAKVRVVLRYTTFHRGSDEAVRILETARLQGLFAPVLETLLETQAEWASHGAPRPEVAWNAAARAGLDIDKARSERLMPHISAALNFDAADVAKLGIRQTPTFFVNGKPLGEFGPKQLIALVQSEVDKL